MFFRKKPKTVDERLSEIRNILFPPLTLQNEVGKEGSSIKFHIDYSVDSNLDAVLMDMQQGINDASMHKTMRTCIERISKIREVLEAHYSLDPEAKYILVDDGSQDLTETIETAD
jgi:hypothetical protein